MDNKIVGITCYRTEKMWISASLVLFVTFSDRVFHTHQVSHLSVGRNQRFKVAKNRRRHFILEPVPSTSDPTFLF
jgi:hypothetical protein